MTCRTVIFGRLRPAGWRRSGASVVALLGLPFSIAVGGMLGYRINLTPSEPLGLWRIVALDRPAVVGDLVFICPPQTAGMAEARRRGYLGSGLCAGGYAPLIKTIAATEGARLAIARSVTINGQALAQSDLRATDGEGRPLARFFGTTVSKREVFVHSPFPASFDSRYFGPIPALAILGSAKPVLTYAP